MSLFRAITGKTGTGLSHGGHRINSGQVLAPTDMQAITPTNPGRMAHIRTAPVVTAPRYFKPGEGQALAELAHRKKAELSETRRAYSALKVIERSDAQLVEVHRGYEAVVADAELHKKAADVEFARHLHHQRPQYAMLGSALGHASKGAGDMIGRYMATANQLAGV